MEALSQTRVDKYLWAIRVFKTRSDAAEACKTNKVKVNGSEAKPSKEIKTGDIIEARKGSVHYLYEVVSPVDKRQGAANVHMYAKDITPQEELDKLNVPVEMVFMKRDRGTGRPTKKERRLIDKLMDEGWDN